MNAIDHFQAASAYTAVCVAALATADPPVREIAQLLDQVSQHLTLYAAAKSP